MKNERVTRMHHIGEFMRFITPALVTIALFMLNNIDRRVERLESLAERVAAVEAVLHAERMKK